MNLRRHLVVVLAAACCAVAGAAGPAGAFTAAAGRAAADRSAIAWARHHQQSDGAFVDYVSRRPTYGYAGVMIGYGLLQAGLRRHDSALIRRGFRAIDAVLRSPHPQRGVFDALANATAYEFALRRLARDPSFAALRLRWESYLRSISRPYIKSKGLRACTVNPSCFHNHEAVGPFGDLQLAKTGVHSAVPGAKLTDPAGLRASARRVLEVEIPGAVGRSATSSRGHPRAGLGLLSDTGTWPLAYHAFSTAMVAGAAADLGADLPTATRAALLGAAHGLAGLMGPDGDVSYIGRRQQQAWALASAVYAGTVASHLPGQDARAAGELRAMADRAFSRLTSVNRFGPGGIGAVPRTLSPRTGYHGVDANEVVPSALVIFLLNQAADEARSGDAVAAAPLPADGDGAFLDPSQQGFAAVRDGDLWYAVHRRTITYDRRYDFGLVALKQRDSRGVWRDILRPRPNTRGPSHDSAGPVIVRGGVRYLPYGESISVGARGVVLVRGGFRSQDGAWLRRGVTFRFAPVAGGVAMRFPLRAGDTARVVAFLPAGAAHRAGPRTVADSRSSATLSLRPSGVRFGRGYASCCDEHLVAATMRFQPARNQTVVYTLRAREGRAAAARPSSAEPPAGQGPSAAAVAGVAVAVLGAVALALAVVRRRRRRSRVGR